MKRNGWTFDAEGLAALSSDNPEASIVIDHNGDIAAVAGHLTKVTAKRGTATIQVTNKDGEKESKTIPSVFLSKEGILTEESLAFPLAWQTVQSYTNAGKTPQTSFSIGIDGIDFDEERDSIFLMPPYRLFHDSLVQSGAFGPDTGVGIMEIEVIDPDGDASVAPEVRFSEDGDEATVSCSPGGVHIANLSAHVASFSASHSGNPVAMAALHAAFPREEPALETVAESDESAIEPTGVPEKEGVETNHQPLNTVENLATTRSHMADSPPDTPKTASQPTEAGAENDAVAMEARLDAMLEAKLEKREAAAEEKRVVSLRTEISEEFDIDAAELADYTTVVSLESTRRLLAGKKRVADAGPRGSERQGKQPDAGDPSKFHADLQAKMSEGADEWVAKLEASTAMTPAGAA